MPKTEVFGRSVGGWYDSNPCLWGKKYDSLYINEPYYSPANRIVICTQEKHIFNEIKQRFLALGYSEEDFIDYGELENTLSISPYQAANYVDIDRFMDYRPEKWKSTETGEGYTLIRKLRRWNEIEELLPKNTDVAFDDFFIDPRKKEIYRDKEGRAHCILKRFELDVTDRCSLKCKHCSAMMQYYKNPQHVPADTVIKDYERMLEIIDWTDDILIMGGEPFLHPELNRILRAVLENPLTDKKVGTVKIMTNATILPNEEIIKTLSGTNVVVGMSNYKANSRSLDKIVEAFNSNNIKYIIVDIPYWKYVEQLQDREQPLDEEERLKARALCSTRNRPVSHGKFYLCCFLKSAHHLNAVPTYDDMWVDIYADDVLERMYDYLDGSKPAPKACSWCNGDSLEQWRNEEYNIQAAEQVKKPLEYKEYVN